MMTAFLAVSCNADVVPYFISSQKYFCFGMMTLREVKVKCFQSSSSLPIILTVDQVQEYIPVSIVWDSYVDLEIDPTPGPLSCFNSVSSVCRFLARIATSAKLYGSSALEKTEIDHWLEFCNRKYSVSEFKECLQKLNTSLNVSTYLVGNSLTLADIFVWSYLFNNKQFQTLIGDKKHFVNVNRWYCYLQSLPELCTAITNFSLEESDQSIMSVKGKSSGDVGKFVDLPGAEMGNVVVRFPPEASGFLHIGHAKAALLNAYYQISFNGKLIMRFDDTNPEKEKEDFEKVILEDVSLLQIQPDIFSFTSDHFDFILEKCEHLLKVGLAFADDTDAETMKTERENRMDSKNRSNSVSKNMDIWQEMKKGTENGKKYCVRAKIDMKSDNGCMRDPTLYRCKTVSHPRTGNKFNVYPTYDFACPIVDSIENVTHALRTTEYHDRDEQYFWVLDSLSMRKPYIYEYSRLNMTNTVLSKRKLTWFVDQGIVGSWDDPRMPTVRGILRRGMTVEGLKQFIIAQGSSRSIVVMEWDKIWAFNKKVIDPIAPRYNAVEMEAKVPVIVNNIEKATLEVSKHPKNSDLGQKIIHVGPRLLIDYADAEIIKVGENVTFINWGNLMIKDVNKLPDGSIESIVAEPNLSDKDYKKTLKITWVPDFEEAPLTPCACIYYDHLVSKPILAKDEDFKEYLNDNTKITVMMVGDGDLAQLKKGDIIQIQRKGFFICDQPYDSSPLKYTSRASSVVLVAIPDGTKDVSTLPKSVRMLRVGKESSKEADNRKKGKAAEKSPLEEQKDIISSDVPDFTVTSAEDLNDQIKLQGEKIRSLKSSKADKKELAPEIEILLQLKKEYKSLVGNEWKPDQGNANNNEKIGKLNDNIIAQGDKIRNLKAAGISKKDLNPEVEVLLQLKKEYKSLSGQEWKPNSDQPVQNSKDGIEKLNAQITQQGEKIRQLKAAKTDKKELNPEIEILLKLKKEYKSVSGQEWKPNSDQPVQNSKDEIEKLNTQITQQGEKIRQLKAAKMDKKELNPEIEILLKLKKEYKSVSGQEWKPNPDQTVQSSIDETEKLNVQITQQGEKIRQLKAAKIDKKELNPEIEILLRLKNEYKNLSNQEWKPNTQTVVADNSKSDKEALELSGKINDQGDKIRKMKAEKAGKDVITSEVNILLSLKASFKNLTGQDWQPEKAKQEAKNKATSETKKTKNEKKSEAKSDVEQKKRSNENEADDDSNVKKITRLGLEAKKEDNLADWYSQVITKSEMIEYYDVSGCYILRPWSYSIWEEIVKFFDPAIKAMGVSNTYFPMFVSPGALEKEKTHIADFAPEVAWVTKSGTSDLAEPIAIRPTSETVMYPAYAKWIRSHRDLPLQLNQWCNVVRWEFKNPQPFIRTREFLWQEGHTAFANREDAVDEVYKILDLYARVYEDLLAIPVVKGKKTEKEKFAGADFTTTLEGYIAANGRAVQGATSHHLGQNFSKMFDITFEDPETNEKCFVHQNSWGLTTRTIGVMTMVHGDNVGLVLPPRVAMYQVVIVPCGITVGLSDADKNVLLDKCKEFQSSLELENVRVKGDLRDNYSPGWKFNHWELKGVPIRIELGPKDLKKNQFVAVRRDTSEKLVFPLAGAAKVVKELLDEIHRNMFLKAKDELDKNMVVVTNFDDFCNKLDCKCIILAPFCGEIPCEDKIKKDSARNADELLEAGAPSMGAKSLCIPFKQPRDITPGMKCINPSCSNKPQYFTLFGRSY